MAARIHKIGNIYSRIDGLIRKGHMTEKGKPIWFDVYRSFPPKYEPTFKRKAPEIIVKEIFYKEDALRAKILKAFPGRMYLFDLSSKELLSEKWLKTCQQYISEGLSEDEAIEKLKVSVSEGEEPSKPKTTLDEVLDDIL